MNKKEIIKKMSGQLVKVTSLNWRDNDDIREYLKITLEKQGFEYSKECKENKNNFALSNGQFIMKEKRKKVICNTLKYRSSFFEIGAIRFYYESIKKIDESGFLTDNSQVEF